MKELDEKNSDQLDIDEVIKYRQEKIIEDLDKQIKYYLESHIITDRGIPNPFHRIKENYSTLWEFVMKVTYPDFLRSTIGVEI